MAKITDLNEIQEVAATIIDEKCPDLVATVGRSNAIWCLVGIYTTNDLMSGYGQDFTLSDEESLFGDPKKVSVISFQNGVSVIVDSHSSRYQDRFPMCGYESLYDDLTQIAIAIQAAFDRIDF